MRLWSIHPRYLDPTGFVALWREALLAQAVLRGETRGYQHHPQLQRFREASDPVGSIAEYLAGVHEESLRRDYRFAGEKVGARRDPTPITVTRGQLDFEWKHLMAKLATRAREQHARLVDVETPAAHPLFHIVDGGLASWERAASAATEVGS
jgi:hypothetical protein